MVTGDECSFNLVLFLMEEEEEYTPQEEKKIIR